MSNRQLSAIMFTDIAGYTSLMGKNRDFALGVLDHNRNIHKRAIENYGGRLVKEIGDGILACFLTASDAVQCAKTIQRELSQHAEYKLKIAIHLCEVEVTDGDVFGDGVNIASRMEGATPPGAIFISDSVFKEIRNMPGMQAISQGEASFKNVDLPVRIYAVSGEGLFVPDPPKTGPPGRPRPISRRLVAPLTILSLILVGWFAYMNADLIRSFSGSGQKTPTLAVLPFENLSGSESDLHFSKGITEDILTQLAKIGNMRVINKANLRKINYLDKSYKEIGAELGVENLLLGSFRKIDKQVRVSARLIQAKTEEQLWAETFDGDIQDYFSIQTEVAIAIAQALKATITAREAEKLNMRPTESITAYDLYLKGKEFYSRYTIEDNLSALELFYQAVDLDPKLALAFAGISNSYSQLAQKSNEKGLWLDSAFKYATITLELDPDLSDGNKSMGLYYTLAGNSKRAISYYEKAVNTDQNIEAVINLSRMYYRTGKPHKAIELLKRVQWYHPVEENIWFSLAAAYYRLNLMDLSKQSLDRALITNPNHINSLLLMWLIAVLEEDGRAAFAAANKLARIGNDNTDAILMEVGSLIEGDDMDYSQRAMNMALLVNGKEKDLVEFEYIFNLIGYFYRKGGLAEKADSLFKYKMDYNRQRIQNGDESYKYPYEIAEIQGAIGKPEEALSWLGKALEKGWTEYSYGLKDPLLQSLRGMDEFNRIVNQAKWLQDSLRSNLQGNRDQISEIP